jgi:hypothetical protein
MEVNEEIECDPQKRAVYESYLNYMMTPKSSIYDYEPMEILVKEPEEQESEEEET